MANLLPRLEFLLQALVRRRRRCPSCGCLDCRRIARKHVVVGVRRCARCQLAFTDPIYDKSLLGDLYDRRYQGEGSTTRLPGPEAVGACARGEFEGSDKDARERLRRLAALAHGRRLLEIGCSWGYFLAQARAEGFEVTGVEPGRRRREFGRRELGLEIVSDLWEVAPRRFDLIYSAHALEHFTRLEGVAEEIARRLAPGGLLAVEVPNFDLEVRGQKALAQVGAVHPLGFSSDCFEALWARAGLAPVRLYERWEDVPERAVARSQGGVIVALAHRRESQAEGRRAGGEQAA